MPFDQTTHVGFWFSYIIECIGMIIGTFCITTVITLYFSVCYYLVACIDIIITKFGIIDEAIIRNGDGTGDILTKLMIEIIDFYEGINR